MTDMFYYCSSLKKIRISKSYNKEIIIQINKVNKNITIEEYDDWDNKLNRFLNF